MISSTFRFSSYVFHWKDEYGFHSYNILSQEFSIYEELKHRAMNSDGFEEFDYEALFRINDAGIATGGS